MTSRDARVKYQDEMKRMFCLRFLNGEAASTLRDDYKLPSVASVSVYFGRWKNLLPRGYWIRSKVNK